MKNIVIGILAHVDAGKTTLSESLLYLSGKIGKMGRVDKKNAYLDNYELERARGITIFSKQAILEIGGTQITLLDTPGHVDFSAEAERTLQVLDYAILVVSCADGVQGHAKTLWKLLESYRIPVFLFINKMDQVGADREEIAEELRGQLHEHCIDFDRDRTDDFYDQLAMCSESMMNAYLETGTIETEEIRTAIRERRVFPCYFGSALRLEGIERFMEGLETYTMEPVYPDEFGAKIYKISRDEQGNRLTHMKLTGGKLKVRDVLTYHQMEEKVNQIRIYSGQKFEAVNEVEAGFICAVTGLTQTRPGDGLGVEASSAAPLLEPVLSYQIILPDGIDPRAALPMLRQLEEENPELHILWEEQLQEIHARIMGEVQTEILRSLIKSRFGIEVAFGPGRIVYKETIASPVEGVGHFEPLRHYAEVHLLLEPGERGSGLQFKTVCSEDLLAENWQRLILTHLEEKAHIGVLTGSCITDMKITLVSGRAHNKHTEGGDFREATYRAVRQGLMEAESILLEPYYAFQLELPVKMVGRAMTDIENMHGICEISRTDEESAVLTGSAPVAAMKNYQQEVTGYSKGLGRLSCRLQGYGPCHNSEEVIQRIGYDPDRDIENPSASVFCANGAGFLVDWHEVKDYMHVESWLRKTRIEAENTVREPTAYQGEIQISLEEIDRIINKTYYANQGKRTLWKRNIAARERNYEPAVYTGIPKETKENYLLVDGYNIIHAWPELKELADGNMDGARMKLLDSLSGYQALRQQKIIVVFDAYRVQGHREEITEYGNLHIVYTGEAQTADQYIEKFAHDNKKKYNIAVATSDGLQQMIVRGAGCSLLSARELKDEIDAANDRIRKEYRELLSKRHSSLMDALSPEEILQLQELAGGKTATSQKEGESE